MELCEALSRTASLTLSCEGERRGAGRRAVGAIASMRLIGGVIAGTPDEGEQEEQGPGTDQEPWAGEEPCADEEPPIARGAEEGGRAGGRRTAAVPVLVAVPVAVVPVAVPVAVRAAGLEEGRARGTAGCLAPALLLLPLLALGE